MINIIKQGDENKKPKDVKTIYETECDNCGCKFEFELEDCEYVEKRIDGILRINCPYCGYSLSKSRASCYCREEEKEKV